MGRILIIKPSSLGDIIHALPVVTALAKTGAEVHFAARRQYWEILDMCPSICRIVDFPGRFSNALAFLMELRKLRYDAVIDLQGLLRSALATACARTSRRIGLPDSREGSVFFYDETVAYPAGVEHAVERYLSVLSRFSDQPPSDIDYGLVIPPEARDEAARLCGDEGYVVFSPLARHNEKMWAEDRWMDMASTLAERKIRVVFVGHGAPSGASCFPSGESMKINLVNRTSLPVLCAVISRARLCVTVDSAPMHLAAALGIPVVSLFGPTDPAKVGPYTRRRMILKGKLPRLADLTCSGVAGVVLSELR